jgi:serine protease Do
MNNLTKTTTILLAAAMISTAAVAQDTKEKTKKSDPQEEIIIRKKTDKGEKTTIVIDGDKVTVNGKPVEDYKGDVTVMKSKRPYMALRSFESPRPRIAVSPNVRVNGYAPAIAGNKAVLGVMTEKASGGVKITNVTDESGAEKAGLKENDVITKVGDKKIATPGDLTEAIGNHKPKDKVDIVYLRDGKESKTTAALSENKSMAYSFNMGDNDFHFDMPDKLMAPSFDGSTFSWNRKPKIGLQIQDVEEGKGVKVNEVDEESPASKSGFKEGDVITQVNGKEIEGVDDLKKQIADLKEGDSIKVSFNREGKSQTADIKIPKRLKTADL